MSIQVKQGGIWKQVDTLYRKVSGSWVPIAEAYQKTAGSWQLVYSAGFGIDLSAAGTDITLQLLAESAGVMPGDNINFVIPQGAVVGGTIVGGYSITSGDLSAYGVVTVENSGHIVGRGGVPSNLNGSGGIKATSPFILINKPTGIISGGGGAGGKGGKGGGAGEYYINLTTERFEGDGASKTQWVYYNTTNIRCWWYGDDLGIPPSGSNNFYSGGKWYKAGKNNSSGFYYIRQADDKIYENGGSGAEGGNGSGYNQAQSTGGIGIDGTGGGGKGGDGGDGGTFGNNGTGGDQGGTAIYSGEIGDNGQEGGTAGYAIYAPGVEITFSNEGTINGETDFIGIPL